jgi:hypothetical protein
MQWLGLQQNWNQKMLSLKVRSAHGFSCIAHHRPQNLVAADLGDAGGRHHRGYIGARTARKLSPRYIRAIVSFVSAGISIAFFLRRC